MDPSRFDDLQDGFLHQTLSEAEFAELNRILAEDADARRQFAVAVDQQQSLGDLYREASASIPTRS